MGFITNNVNIFLLTTIVIIVIFGVVFFNIQESIIKDMTDKNKELNLELKKTKNDLSYKEERLQTTFDELQKKLKDLVKFEGLYQNITNTKEELSSQLNDVKKKYTTEQALRKLSELDFKSCSENLQTTKFTLQKRDLELKVCNSELKTCQNDLGTCTNN